MADKLLGIAVLAVFIVLVVLSLKTVNQVDGCEAIGATHVYNEWCVRDGKMVKP